MMKSQRGLFFRCLFALILGMAALPGGLHAADSIILGKPTANSIAVNVIRDVGGEISFEYGTASGASGSYDIETGPVSCSPGEPTEVVLNSLQGNTRYYYRLRYRVTSGSTWTAEDEYTFHTQRAAGSPFVFTVTSDSHFSTNSAQQNAMTNILNDQPDFNLDLGDTFMVDNVSGTQSAVNGRYETYRGPNYFGKIGPSVPIFLTQGNHEEEEGWNLDDSPFSYGVANIQARKAYFPTPINSGFYSGNTDPLAAIDEGTYGDENREDYYAWTWGDALYVVIDEFQYTMDLPYTPTAGEKSDDTVTGDQWSWTLGKQQYDWLKQTLENSDAKYKFVFSHHMLGGVNRPISGVGAGYVRGGAEAAAYYEWGGRNEDGSWGFDTMRSGWGVDAEHPNGTPIHQLFVDNGVSAYFHGHDHQYVYETRDGVVYQEMPSPGMSGSGFGGIYTEGTYSEYNTIEMLPNSGHLRITVNPTEATVEYVSSGNYSSTGTVNYTYTIEPNQTSTGPTGEVTVDGAVSSDTADDVDSISFAHTTGAGTDRLMLVGVSWNSNTAERDITSVTFSYGSGPTVLTLDAVIDQQGDSQPRNAAIYSLLNPPSGTSGTVTVNFSGSVASGIVAGAANFAGVDQTTPLGTPAGATGSSATSSVTLTGLAGDELVFDTAFQGASGETQTLTADAGQTEQWNGWAGNTRAAASVEQATGSSATMSWTAGSSSVWVIAAVPINPAPFSGTTYDLTMANDGNGTTTPAEGVHTYAEGSVVNIIAAPNVGFVFDSWSGDPDCADGSVTMDGNKTCTANFVEAPPSSLGLDGSISSGTADGVSSINVAHATGTGTNRLMLVGISANDYSTGVTISSVTFTPSGGGALDLSAVGSIQNENGRFAGIYSLLDPPSGVSGTVTVTFSGTIDYGIVVGVANFAGVDQTYPVDDFVSAIGTEANPISIDVPSDPGDIVFDTMFLGAATLPNLAAGDDQTQQWNYTLDRVCGVASTEQATGSTTSMSWTASGGATSYYWAIGAVPINPVGSAPKIPANNIVLGRPTDDSVTVNAILEQGGEVAYEYGTVSGSYGSPTSAEPCSAGEPVEVVISGLSANTQYFYRLLYRTSSGGAWIPGAEHSFHTQRASGETFTFTITSDSHLGDTFNGNDPNRYEQTTQNVDADNPDFNIDLGDTFIMNSPTNQEEANAVYMAQRPYIGNYSHSSPVFLAIGNHENEEGWNLDDTPFSKALGSINARKKYFVNPIPGGIYTGNSDTLSGIDDDQLREDYYAWEWGDVLFIVLDPFQYTMVKPYELDPFNENETETGDQWEWTLGLQQFQWFKDTLENSNAKYKFVFSHHMLGGVPYEAVGGADAGYVRRGAEAASYFEWGGQNADGSPGFGDERPVEDWGSDPIHQLMLANGVKAYFHGHDHQFVHEMRDGIVYQEVPSAAMGSGDFGFDLYDDSPYVQPGGNLPNAGHLRVTVFPNNVLVEYVRSAITGDGISNGDISYSYYISDITHDLTIAVDPSGSGTTSPAVGTTTYSEGAVVSITATPNPGHVFDHWTGDVVDPNAASTTVTMDGDKTVTATFVEVTIPTDMVGYWPFDGGSGIDGSSFGNDATIFGAVPAAGYVGDALDFNGAGDHVVIPNDSSLSMASNSITVACWIYPDSLATEWSTIIQRDNASGSWFDWQLYARASDAPTAFHPVFRMDWDQSGDSGSIPASEQVEGDIILSTNTWYHIAATYDGSQMKFYIDGTLRGTTPVNGTIPNSGKDIWIGGNEVWGEYFAGLIDELYIFDRALSEEEIQALMNPVIDCPGDFDFSGNVNEADLAIFAANFGLTDCSGGCVGDIDPDSKDNDVDALDLLKFVEVFGTYCPF